MSVKEFIDKYNLHDSFFKEVKYDQSTKTLSLLIDFSFWMQNDYVEGEPESGILRVTFRGVESYTCPQGDPCGDFAEILDAKIDEQGRCIISLSDDMKNDYFEMQIHAKDVSVSTVL